MSGSAKTFLGLHATKFSPFFLMQEKFLGVFMGGVFFLKGRMEGEIAGQRKEKKNCRRHDFSHQKKKKKIME